MKRPIIVVLIVAVLAVCAVPIVQSSKLSRQKHKLAAARTELEKASQELEKLQADNEQLNSESRELRRQLQEIKTQLAITQPRPATNVSAADSRASAESESPTSKEKEPALRGLLSKMMDDPEMRKFIRNQQRQMLDPLYQPLIKRLGLSKDEANAFKDFLADTQMKSTQQSTALFGGSEAERKEAVETFSADQKQNEQYIREFLGEERYAEYKDYQETLGERMQLNQFKTQNTGSENALTDDQTEWLLTVMKEEKQAVSTQTGQTMPGAGANPSAMQEMLSDGGTDKFLTLQETINQRVYERAAENLSPEQLESFGQFQSNQLLMMRAGMSMAKQMFGPEAPESGSGASGQ